MIAWPVLLLYLYGILLFFGGLYGYLRVKSRPSLIAGTLFGLLAIALGYDYTWHFAPHLALVLSLLLIWTMSGRYLRTRQPMPALPITGFSIVVAIVQLYVIFFVGVGSSPF